MSFFRVFLFVLLLPFLINCGGSDEPINVKILFTPDGTELLIERHNLTITKTPDSGTTVIISGNNNLITLTKKPKTVKITGNDNYIRLVKGTTYTDSGSGNIIKLIK